MGIRQLMDNVNVLNPDIHIKRLLAFQFFLLIHFNKYLDRIHLSSISLS